MLTILLAGPGGNWMGFLIPLVLLVVLLKGGSYLYGRFTAWNAARKRRKHHITQP
ncbi:MAG: hypothetical protein JSS82_16930 [Bacteroidetes bacterium]|nr:hypothetical protein [Bacteroidota bacterium]